MARRSIWTRAKPCVGLERPHFCTRFRGQSDAWGRSSPRGDSSRCFARACRRILRRNMCRKRVNKVKTVRITPCTFKTATSSPNARPTEFILKRFPTATSAKVTAHKRVLRHNLTCYFTLDRGRHYENQSDESSRRTKLCAAQTAPGAGAPHPLTHGASRLPCGRSRPHRNFGAAFCALAYTDPRICQTRSVTICMKTKGEARCLY